METGISKGWQTTDQLSQKSEIKKIFFFQKIKDWESVNLLVKNKSFSWELNGEYCNAGLRV